MATTQDRGPGPKTKPNAKLETKGNSGDRGSWHGTRPNLKEAHGDQRSSSDPG